VQKVLRALQLLLAEPGWEDPLVVDVAKQLRDDPAAFDATAREWTAKFAVP